MPAIDRVFEEAVGRGDVPGVVAMARLPDGSTYEGAFGVRELGQPAPMTPDSIFRIFSMTKAVASIAAVQLVERGEIELDQPVETILPAFAELQVLEGFDGDRPVTRAPRTQATIRHLATHTAGMAYEVWSAETGRYLKAVGRPGILSGEKRALGYPLLFDPGTCWTYGINIDWLGQVVEAVSGRPLEAYCEEHLFAPLGMADTMVECEGPARERLVGSHARGPDGSLAPFACDPPRNPEFYGGGHALYSTAGDYLRFLDALLAGGGPILKPETVAMLCENHIGDLEIGPMKTVAPALSNDAEFFPGMPKKHGLAFMTNLEQAPGRRAAGSQFWAGLLNTYFWWDPGNRVAGVILMQLLPFADTKALALLDAFEEAVYAHH